MRVGKKLFPYPVLNNSKNNSGFGDSNYQLMITITQNENYFIIEKAYVEVENQDIERMLADGRAKAIMVVECSATVFREKYEIGIEPKDISIPIGNLNDKVEISSFIYANQDIEHFNSNDFLEDFADFDFSIEKYDILAVDDGYTTKVVFDEDKDKKMSSIFSVIKSNNKDLNVMTVSSENKQIVIEMPSQYFDYHDNMKHNDNFQNIFFAIIAIPALTQCLQEIKECFSDVYSMDINEVMNDKTWFVSIANRYQAVFGTELTSDEFIDCNTYEVAQKLLNCGSTKAIEDFYNLLWNGRSDSDDE